MKDKSFKLLKELLLLQTAGADNLLDESINIAIDMYCEIANINNTEFIAKLDTIKKTVWVVPSCEFDGWEQRQATYEKMIDSLKI